MKVVLTGFSGTGKTTVGKIVAEQRGMKFFDVKQEIERRENDRSVRIVQVKGEEYFRGCEEAVITRLSREKDAVIAVAETALFNPSNERHLKTGGVIICLTAEPAHILLRTSSGSDERGVLLRSTGAIRTIRKIMKMRKDACAKADHTIDTSALTPEEVADKVISFLNPSTSG